MLLYLLSLVNSCNLFLNVWIVLMLLMSGGTVFQTDADLTMNDLPANDDSTAGTLRLPCTALLVTDG